MTMIEALQIESARMTGEKTAAAVMRLGEYHTQPQGYLNGGATLAFAEIAAGMLSNSLLKDDESFAVGQSVTAHHLRPMKAEGTLTARGELLLCGRTSHVWRFDMVDDKNRLISQVTVTCAVVPKDR